MPEPEIVVLEETPTAVIRAVVPVVELPSLFDRAFPILFTTVQKQGLSPTGAAFGLYHGLPTDTVDLEVGVAIDGAVTPQGEVVPATLPAGRVARLVHAGSYDELGASWERLRSWMLERGLTPGQVLWEVYLDEPSPDRDPADLHTELNWPIAAGA